MRCTRPCLKEAKNQQPSSSNRSKRDSQNTCRKTRPQACPCWHPLTYCWNNKNSLFNRIPLAAWITTAILSYAEISYRSKQHSIHEPAAESKNAHCCKVVETLSITRHLLFCMPSHITLPPAALASLHKTNIRALLFFIYKNKSKIKIKTRDEKASSMALRDSAKCKLRERQ